MPRPEGAPPQRRAINSATAKSHQKKLLFILAHPFHARMFLSSGMIDRLREHGAHITLLLDPGSYQYLERTRQLTGDMQKLESIYKPGAIRTWLRRKFQDWILVSYRDASSTYRLKVNQMKRSVLGKLRLGILETIDSLLSINTIGHWIERRIPVPKSAILFLEGERFDEVFFSTLIHDQDRYIDLLKAARKLRIRTAGYISSWDNLTSKGFFSFLPDRLFVWGETDRNSAISIFGLQEEQVHITGAPHFDFYFRPSDSSTYERERERFFQQNKLNPERILISYAATTFRFNASESGIIKAIMEASEKGMLPPLQILFRPHPKSPLSYRERIREELSKIPHAYFDEIDVEYAGTVNYPIHTGSLQHGMEVIYFCDLLVSAFSTMVLEAAMNGKPCVGVAFSLEPQFSKRLNELIGNMAHLSSIKDWPGIYASYNIDDVVRNVGLGLSQKDLYREQLKKNASKIASNVLWNSQDRFQSLLLD